MIESGIYAIVNAVNGRRYIGSSINIKKRFIRHRTDLKRGVHDNPYLQRAWKKYGAASFQFLVIEETHADEMIEREQFHLDRFIDHVYNVGPVARAPNVGRIASAEARAKISAKHKGKKLSPEHIAGMRARMLGVKMLPQTAAAIRASHIGRIQSEQERAKRSKSLIGKKRSPEHSKAISAAKRGVSIGPHSLETRQKMAEARREYWRKKRERVA